MRKLTFLACLIFAFSVPVQAQDVATIQRLADQFAEAYNKSGAEGVGAMYTDDAIVVPPEADIRTGRRDIQAFWTQQARQGENLEIVVLDVKPLGADTARALVSDNEGPTTSAAIREERGYPAEDRGRLESEHPHLEL